MKKIFVLGLLALFMFATSPPVALAANSNPVNQKNVQILSVASIVNPGNHVIANDYLPGVAMPIVAGVMPDIVANDQSPAIGTTDSAYGLGATAYYYYSMSSNLSATVSTDAIPEGRLTDIKNDLGANRAYNHLSTGGNIGLNGH